MNTLLNEKLILREVKVVITAIVMTTFIPVSWKCTC